MAFGFGHLRSKGIGVEEFCSGHTNLVEVVLPWQSVSKLLQAKGSWTGLEDDIEAATMYADSSLGDKMFSFARSASADGRASRLVEKEILLALATGNLTMALVSKCRENIQAQLQVAFLEEDLDRPRTASIPYIADARVKLEVPSGPMGMGHRHGGPKRNIRG